MTRKLLVLLWVLMTTGSISAEYFVTDFVDAARRGDYHAVHKLIELDAAVVTTTDEAHFTALHWAGIRGHWRIFRELIEAGAPVNAVGGDGGTPLHWACHHDRADMVQLLVDAGARPDVQNRWGRSPLHVAARRNCLDVAALLLDRGADPKVVTFEGWTPLHVAERAGHPEMVKLLTAHGANPEQTDKEGLRPQDARFVRPKTIAIDPVDLQQFTGLFDNGHGLVKVWIEDDRLRIREFAPDHLDPIGTDTFLCRREPWRIVFHRDESGEITSVDLDFLRRTVSATRVDQAHYVGSHVCQTCHLGAESGNQSVHWMRSRHGHAYWNLGTDWAMFLAKLRPNYQDMESPINDDRCLLCHTVGAQDDNSLFAPTFRLQEGVGCEACHGPGSNYIEAEVMADRERFLANGGIIPDEHTCRSCHRNSERFDYAELRPKIAHPRPGAESPEAHE